MTYDRRRSSPRCRIIGVAIWIVLLFGLMDRDAQEEMLPLSERSEVSSALSEDSVMISLYRDDLGKTVDLSLEDYIVGVVAAEMPCDFNEEALRAQAVIARTYTLWKMGKCEHESGDLCDAPGHCQAYRSVDELREQWGSGYDASFRKVKNAVYDTAGMVLLYDGELAETYYHSTCGGKTASALEVWGEDIPYLRSVDCLWDSDAPRYRETVSVSLDELPWLLGDGVSPCIAVARGDTVSYVPVESNETESGRAREVSYAGLVFDASDFREALGLNSTRFTLTAEGNLLHITTYGFGHGVGLCQYGADGLAREGKTFEEILLHYYPGVTLKK